MNALILGLINEKNCTKEQAKKIYRLIRDNSYSLEKAYLQVMGPKEVAPPELPVFAKTKPEPIYDDSLREDVKEALPMAEEKREDDKQEKPKKKKSTSKSKSKKGKK